MAGGLLQLIAVGQQNAYITENPQISFYKYVYKRHTNFSMESIQLTFDTNPILSPTSLAGGYFCKIGRYGDLLSELYLSFTLPDIYSDEKYKFRWVENVGNLFIKKATVTVGGIIIDTITGEWFNIWNELILSVKSSHDVMIGNVEELINPKLNNPRIGIRNNKFYYSFYPSSSLSQGGAPSIRSRQIYLPLKFWFNKNPALALPLLRLQYSEIYLNIEVENSENLYQVYSEHLERYVSPIYYNELYTEKINIYTFVKNIALNPYIEANYIFLANDERNRILLEPRLMYLVEQLEISTEQRTLSSADSSITINLNIHKPTKEIIWTLRRDDYYKFNEHNNYTASIPEDKSHGILNKGTIIWNRTNMRIDEKNADYFNLIQPYTYHTNVPRQGIYCYSFALYPEKEQPTGSYNASTIDTSLLLYINGKYNNDEINKKLLDFNKKTYMFDYLIKVYSIGYNVFEIVGGSCGMKFA
jgi:hypothetical protein